MDFIFIIKLYIITNIRIRTKQSKAKNKKGIILTNTTNPTNLQLKQQLKPTTVLYTQQTSDGRL